MANCFDFDISIIGMIKGRTKIDGIRKWFCDESMHIRWNDEIRNRKSKKSEIEKCVQKTRFTRLFKADFSTSYKQFS